MGEMGASPERRPTGSEPKSPLPWWELLLKLTGIDPMVCPYCKRGRFHKVALLTPEWKVPNRSPP